MTLSYDLYQPGDSFLHRLDPRTKLLLVLCSTLVVLLYQNLWVMLAVVLALQLALWSARPSRERLAWLWRTILPPMAMIAVLWVLFYPAEKAWWSFWLVRIGPQNVSQALAVALRLGALAMAVFCWLFTTDQAALVRGLVSLGLPYEWGLVLSMALRYLPTMALIFRTISEAQQARGLDLSEGGPMAKARKYLPILVATIIAALRTADQLSRAMESRALGASPQRTYLRALHFGRIDAICAAIALATTIALIWARLAVGFGTDALRLLP